MSNRVEVVNVGGQEVYLEVPEDAVITKAVVAVQYQEAKPEGIAVGGQYGTSPMPMMDAVGLLRVTTIAVERDAV